MAREIERKFLVKGDAWRARAKGTTYRQGYLNSAKERTVRVRTADKKAYLTIKGLTVGATRAEYEYKIPFHEGKAMLDTLTEKPLIEKRRYKIRAGHVTWEIDEFLGDNAGLIVAEVELKRKNQRFARPIWLGDEVTGDPRYYNANLIKNPFMRWGQLATRRKRHAKPRLGLLKRHASGS
jgi:adenylate cyclase